MGTQKADGEAWGGALSARRSGSRWKVSALAACFALLVSACDSLDKLLEVELPGNVTEADLNNPTLARTLVLSAQGDFECGFAQHILFTGYWAEEVWNTNSGLASAYWSLRSPSAAGFHAAKCVGGGEGPTWTPLQVSRVRGEDAIERIQGWESEGIDIPNSEYLIARAELYVGYSYELLSEAFCELAFDAGPIQSRQDGFRLAEQHFTSALQHAAAAGGTGADSIANAARVGRARARLNLGDGPGVLSDAGGVSQGFAFLATYDPSPNRRVNHVASNFIGRGISVPANYQNLSIGGVADERVSVFSSGRLAGDGVTPHWGQRKYLNEGAEIPLATWREAQLMIAEVAGGQTAVDAINALRDTYSLPDFASSDPAEIQMQVREERRRELWIQGSRMADMLRWSEPFPTGVDHRGRAFGTGTCAPLPDAERFGNPNIG